jgi:hypothetical protein
MTTSPVSVANMALTRLGGKSIASLDERSRESIVINGLFQNSLETVLRAHPWGFAGRQRVLAVVDSPLDGAGWAYVYGYPADCLAVRKLHNPVPGSDPVPYEVTTDGNGTRVVLSDLSNAVLLYTARLADLSRADPLFIEALSYKIAAEIAIPLTQDKNMWDIMQKLYQAALSQARTVDANEGQARAPGVASWLQARGA